MDIEKSEDINPKYIQYEILQIKRDATQNEIKKKYYELARTLHPDKNDGTPEATKNFQKIVDAYKILSDPAKKKIYDKTGDIEGIEGNIGSFVAAYQYYRKMYKEVTKQDIESFAKTYPNSAEETEDLLDFFYDAEGDMTGLLECIPLSETADIPRFIEFFKAKIAEGEIDEYIEIFNETIDEVRELPDEKDEFKKMQEEQEFLNLQKTIMLRQQQRQAGGMDYLDMLEEKYGGGKNKKTGAGKENKAVGKKKKAAGKR